MNVSVLMSPCQTAGRMIYCYLSRFATGLLMQEDGSCPRSSGGRAMTLRGSQSAGEAQRPGWWLVVRARPGLAAPVTTSTWSASPCTGRRTRPVTTPTRTWTTRTLWWSVIGSRGTTVGRVECSATFSLPLRLWQGEDLAPAALLARQHGVPLPSLLLHHQQALPGPALARGGEATGHVQDQSDIPGRR